MTLVSGGYDSQFRVWDVATGQETYTLPGNRRGHVAFWPGHNYLLAGGLWGSTKLYDTTSWQIQAEINQFDGLWWLAFSPDGAMLATVHAQEPILLRDTSTWQVTGKIETQTQCYSVAFIPNTEVLAMALWPSHITVVETVTGREVTAFDADASAIYCITVSPNGRLAALGDADKNAVLWNTATWTVEATFAHRASVISATFSPDSRYLVTGALDGTISFWQIEGNNG